MKTPDEYQVLAEEVCRLQWRLNDYARTGLLVTNKRIAEFMYKQNVLRDALALAKWEYDEFTGRWGIKRDALTWLKTEDGRDFHDTFETDNEF